MMRLEVNSKQATDYSKQSMKFDKKYMAHTINRPLISTSCETLATDIGVNVTTPN